MPRRLLLALALPAIMLAGCDSLARFTRAQPSIGDGEPTAETLAAETLAAETLAAETLAAETLAAETPAAEKVAASRVTPSLLAGVDAPPPADSAADPSTGPSTAPAGASARLSDLERAAPSTASANPSASASPTAAPASEVQLAAATGLSSAARRTFDAVVASLPNPAASGDTKLTREVAAFRAFPFAFTLPTVDGRSLDSRQTDSQLIVVDIWATWCGPCRKAIPDFVAIQDAYASRGVQVVGITCDSADPSKAAEVSRKAVEIGERLNVNYPLLIDDGSTTAQVPGFRGYPTTLFLTPSGQVLYKVTGMQTEAQLAAILDHLLPTPESTPAP